MKKAVALSTFVIFFVISTFAQSESGDVIDTDSLELMVELGIVGESELASVDVDAALGEVINGREIGDYMFGSGCPNEVVHEGPFAYVANTSSIEILNISDPENPQLLLSQPATDVIGIDVQGGNIFTTSPTCFSIYQYDYEQNDLNLISTFYYLPDTSYQLPDSVEYRYVAVSGTHAFISCKYGLEVVDITDITNPTHDIFVKCGKYNKDLVAKDYMVFMSGAFYGVHIFNFESHFATGGGVKPKTLTYSPTHGKMNCVDVDINGDLLYVADYYNGLEIFNWRESDWLGECLNDILGYPTGVAVSGDWAYLTTDVGSRGGFLFVIDVQYPSFSMTAYARYSNPHGAVSPDPCSHLMAFVSGRTAATR